MLHEQLCQRRRRRSGARKPGDNSAPLLFTRKNVGYWPCVSAGRRAQWVIPQWDDTLCAAGRRARAAPRRAQCVIPQWDDTLCAPPRQADRRRSVDIVSWKQQRGYSARLRPARKAANGRAARRSSGWSHATWSSMGGVAAPEPSMQFSPNAASLFVLKF